MLRLREDFVGRSLWHQKCIKLELGIHAPGFCYSLLTTEMLTSKFQSQSLQFAHLQLKQLMGQMMTVSILERQGSIFMSVPNVPSMGPVLHLAHHVFDTFESFILFF